MRIRDIICEYARNDDSWGTVPGVSKDIPNLDEEYMKPLRDAFASVEEMKDIISGGMGEHVDIHHKGDELFFNIFHHAGIDHLQIIYPFDVEDGDNFLYFEAIESEDANKSFATALRIMRGMIRFCKRMGITKISIPMAKDGSYQWTRLGAKVQDCTPWDIVVDEDIYPRLDKMLNDGIITQQEFAEYKRIADMKSKDIIYAFAATKHGKQILYDIQWHGILDLTDAECLQKLRKFVKV